MAVLPVQQIGITGPTITPVPAQATDSVKPGPTVFLIYENTNGATRDITVQVPGTRFGQPNPDVPVTIAATNGREYIGPLTRDLADPVTGLVNVTVGPAVAGVSVAAARI